MNSSFFVVNYYRLKRLIDNKPMISYSRSRSHSRPYIGSEGDIRKNYTKDLSGIAKITSISHPYNEV